MPAALQADELRHVIEILAKDKLPVFGEHRYRLSPELTEPISPGLIIQHIDRDEVDAFFRKKLFRSKATASPGLGEQYECGHGLFPLTFLTKRDIRARAKTVPRRDEAEC
jgi:hypothetical protein